MLCDYVMLFCDIFWTVSRCMPTDPVRWLASMSSLWQTRQHFETMPIQWPHRRNWLAALLLGRTCDISFCPAFEAFSEVNKFLWSIYLKDLPKMCMRHLVIQPWFALNLVYSTLIITRKYGSIWSGSYEMPFLPAIGPQVLNATQWVLLEASKSVEQAVFVGIVEPPARTPRLQGYRFSSKNTWRFLKVLDHFFCVGFGCFKQSCEVLSFF